MKREHREIGGYSGGTGGGGFGPAAEDGVFGGGGKGKMMMMMMMMEEQLQQDAGVDELLAVLGYKVRSSEMADVAQKMEQLEMAMGGSATGDDALLSHLAADTVHYNPSDLSNWLESMLSELNDPPPPPPLPPPPPANNRHHNHHFLLPPLPLAAGQSPSRSLFGALESICPAESSTITSVDDFHALPTLKNLKFPDPPAAQSTAPARDRKRMRSSSSSASSGKLLTASVTESSSTATPPATPPIPVVVIDLQEAGIRLVHVLMACAEAVQQDNLKAADVLVKQIAGLAASQGSAMRKVAGYFAEALARRIYRIQPQQQLDRSLDAAFSDILHMHFYESCPYLKFAHFTANQAILEAFAGCRRVHVIDFGMKQGLQWPALMQALALRPGGPPSFRLTGIGPPQPDGSDALQQVGWKLAQLADTMRVTFEYRGLVASSLADLEPYMLANIPSSEGGGEEPEALAVNSVFELHHLLARTGSLEKVLGTIRAMRPRIVSVVEQEASHNSGPFLERFTEALHYYSAMFDSLEGGGGAAAAIASEAAGREDQMMSEVYLGRQICNVVACEGIDRTERHETLAQWRGRMSHAGFEPVHLGSNAFKQASMLLALFSGGDEYRVEEKEGSLTLGWHTRPLIATSAWRLAGDASAIASR